ncbi:protein kinase domain-containing protein [Myxococcus qinghaiensis]|uniref:protein kinase domain-containing protein n=1 Tax=Myxococcus qinghaiensis TaxID=2906758 RepID=UPI0020A76DB9|nr:protein kinase [Myxococcus qinghaiensis]MCP3163763.1 protein kinase [Myxococcus qinghaiensis]
MQVGKYQLVRKLASGGMAEVFLAKAAGPMGFEKTLVLKRILPHLAEDPAFVEMFLGEARLAAQLEHPNIVQIFDFGEADGSYFLAMEFIDGPTLRRLVKRAAEQSLPPMMCAKLVSLAAEGLAFAHDFSDAATGVPLGLIHRDVSPDNILVSRQGAVKVVDFGVAKVAGQGHRTQTGMVKGKVAYMPPEQLRALSVDKRVDVYALGVVLYELLTGKRPFDATTEASTMQAILFEPFVPVVERRPDVPVALQKILELALAKERDRRYPDCRALQADLERFLLTSGESVGAYQLSQFVAKLGAEGVSGPVVPSPVPVAGATPVKPGSAPKSMAAPPPPPVDSTSPTTPMPLSMRGVADEVRPQAPANEGSKGAEAPERAAKAAAGARRKPAPRPMLPAQAGVASEAHGTGGDWSPSRIAGAQAPARQSPESERDAEERVPTNGGGSDEDAIATGAQVRAPKARKASAGLLAALVGAAVLGVGGVALVSIRGEQPIVVVPPPLPLAKKPDAKLPPTTERVEKVKPSPAPERVAGGDAPVVARVPPVVEVKKADPPATAPVPSPEVVAEKPVEKAPPAVVPAADAPVVPAPQEAKPVAKSAAPRPRAPAKVVATGMLEFRIRPYATVYLNGKDIGNTPMAPVSVPEGKHTIRLVNPELKRDETQKFEVKAGQNNTFKFNFNTD